MVNRPRQCRARWRRTFACGAIALASGAGYLLLWPVDVNPQRWIAPPVSPLIDVEELLLDRDSATPLSLGGAAGPETLTLTADGAIVTGTANGDIVRVDLDCRAEAGVPTIIANTGGRPLGIAVRADGSLIVADAIRGLLLIDVEGDIVELVTSATPTADGVPLGFANSVALDGDGRIWFTDASSRFTATSWTIDEAPFLDLLEHGGHGRLLCLDPRSNTVETVLGGLQFANGVALAHDGASLLICETGLYRVLRLHLTGVRAGEVETLLEGLPGFPDNITAGPDGRHWIGLVAERSALLDTLSDWPTVRRILARIPARIRPDGSGRNSAIAIDSDGRVVARLTDMTGSFRRITAVLETERFLHVGTLAAPTIGRAQIRDAVPHAHRRSRAPGHAAGHAPGQ